MVKDQALLDAGDLAAGVGVVVVLVVVIVIVGVVVIVTESNPSSW